MTQQNKGTPGAPGSNDRNRDASAQPGRKDESTKGRGDTSKQTPLSASGSASQAKKSGSDCSTSSAPTAQGGKSGKSDSGECCEPKSAKSTERDRSGVLPQKTSPTNLSPVGPKGTIDNLPTPTMSQGDRQIKGDENRSSQERSTSSPGNSQTRGNSGANDSGNSSRKQPSTAVRADSGHVPANAESQPGRKDLTRPRDPNEFGRTDPVQPKRAAPIQPSRVVQPSIGTSAPAGDGDES